MMQLSTNSVIICWVITQVLGMSIMLHLSCFYDRWMTLHTYSMIADCRDNLRLLGRPLNSNTVYGFFRILFVNSCKPNVNKGLRAVYWYRRVIDQNVIHSPILIYIFAIFWYLARSLVCKGFWIRMQYMFLADSPSYIRLTNQKWLADLRINIIKHRISGIAVNNKNYRDETGEKPTC